jgi:hypothetical protein
MSLDIEPIKKQFGAIEYDDDLIDFTFEHGSDLIAEIERLRAERAKVETIVNWLMTRGFAYDYGIYTCFASEHSIGLKLAELAALVKSQA